MNAVIPSALLLVPAALVAAADTALDRQLLELETLFTRDVPQAAAARYGAGAAEAWQPWADDSRALIARFRETGDARFCTPEHGITLLHLACFAQRAELVRALLAAGADPNVGARDPKEGRWTDSPLLACVRGDLPGLPPADVAARRQLIDTLVAAGAEVTGKAGADALLACAGQEYAGAEELALYLLGLGAGRALPQHPRAYSELAYSGKPRLLEAVMQARLVPLEGEQLGDFGTSLLGLRLRAGVETDAERACVALLLRHGADPHVPMRYGRTYGHDHGVSPADLIHGNPELRDWLRAQGIEVPHTPRELELGEHRDAHTPELAQLERLIELQGHLYRMSLLARPPRESLLPIFDDLGRDLAHSKWDHRSTLDLRLMVQADAARAAAHVQQLPLWQDDMGRVPWPWTEEGRATFAALTMPGELRLPTDFIVDQAERLAAAGHQRQAHDLLCLLGRNADAVPVVERLCHSPQPALAAAACSARLELAGLRPRAYAWYLRSLPPGADEARLTRLRRALNELGLMDEQPGRFGDFSDCWHWAALTYEIPSLVSPGFMMASNPELRWAEDEAELVNTLRELGEPEAAAFVQQLFDLRYEREREYVESVGKPADSTAPDEDYEEEATLRARLERIGSSPEAERHAFVIEAALGRFLWELYQKNTK